MKNVTIFLCTLYLVSYAVVNANDSVLQCVSQAGSTLAELPSLFSSNNDESIRKRGCIEACLLQNLGYMNGNTINIGFIEERINEVITDNESKDGVVQSIRQCADNAANGDECMVAQRFLRCNLDGVQQTLQQVMTNLLSQINTNNLGISLFNMQ
ncbi:uncharacterized protein LOC143424733 [Xylocopa sonorina]|uniref:uncharacterized protein LOC143424733 n=1 Tax=Xylocopa sonorina TaxID=1818115 RepID=UPI00403AB9A1